MGEVFLDRYEVEYEIGQGGMAVVYRGVDRILHRPVAIKVLHAHLAQKAEARARFAREARIIARLRHPNVVEVYDFAQEDSERAFIVAEFIEGITLSDFLRQHGPMQPELAACVVSIVARALHHAHQQGVIHRDVKPENIMVRRDGLLKLMDFGIAHVVDMEHLTVTGAIVGSPAHMSPEQVDGRALDARTDIFSMGTLLFLIASGRYPFMSDTPSGLLKAIAEAKVPDVRVVCPSFSDELYAVLRRMMTRNPDDRYQSAADVASALEQAVSVVGVADAEAEVKRFFLDPSNRSRDVKTMVASMRVGRAKELLRKGKVAAAIRELNVAIANEPQNEEALRLLMKTRRYARHREVFRTLAIVAGIVILVAALVTASMLSEPEVPEVVSTQRPELVLAPAEMTAFPKPRLGVEQVPLTRGSRPHKTPPIPRPSDVQTLIPVVIQADPPAVRITLDGHFVGEGITGELRLTPGRHRVHLSHPSCTACLDVEKEFVLEGAPGDNPRRLRFSIAYRDAILRVSGPLGAKVAVNGVIRGRTNEDIAIPMNQPKPAPVTVSVLLDGQPTRVSRVVLESGKTSVLELP